MKVLVVDDNAQFLRLFKFYTVDIKSIDFVFAKSGLEALQIINEDNSRDFKLVVSDIRMPLMSGIELSKIIHNDFPELSVILITGMEKSYLKKKELVYAEKVLSKEIGCDGIISVIKSYF